MPKHGEKIEVNFRVTYPVNVCQNKECGMDFVLLSPREDGFTWEQVANKVRGLYCPYCGDEIKPGTEGSPGNNA